MVRDKDKTKAQLISELNKLRQQFKQKEEFQKSRDNFRSFFNSIDDLLFVLNKKGNILSINETVKTRLGYTEEELYGVSVLKIHPRERWEEAKKIIADTSAGITQTWSIPFITKAGKYIHAETRMVKGTWSGEEVLLAVGKDISEIKQSEEKFSKVFQTNAALMAINKMEDGSFIDVNDTFIKTLGYRREEVIGKSTRQLGILKDAQKRKQIMQDIKEKGYSRNYEAAIMTKSGELRHGLFSVDVIHVQGKKYILTAMVDITERKKIHQQIQKIDKLESLGFLAGGIAHDFNNLLTAILANISLAKTSADKDVIIERLIESEKASLWAKDLTQQLLTFSKGGDPVREITSISDLLKNSCTFATRGSKVRCQFSLPDDLWMANIDKGQVNQVIQNLVVNAIQAMPSGGTIQIEANNVGVNKEHLLPIKSGKYVKVAVKDTGIGIPEKYLSKVFDPYFSTKTHIGRGTGLGLSICHSIIEKHKGFITVESEQGVGTSFIIYLPASPKHDKKKQEKEDQPISGEGKILFMDDEKIVRDIARQMLDHLGYEACLAADGTEAVKLYQEATDLGKPFDAVILDLTVQGGMGGKDALSKLFQIDPQIKAIVSSGYSNDPIMQDYKEHGFTDVIVKPYDLKELSQILHKVLLR